MTAGRDAFPRRDPGRQRSVVWWFIGGVVALATTMVLIELAVSVVPQPWDGAACVVAFLPVIAPTRYLRLRVREG